MLNQIKPQNMTETQASSFDRISPTAIMTARARQFIDIPYSKELSDLLDAQIVLEQMSDETLKKRSRSKGQFGLRVVIKRLIR
jgi:hypothetical protein